MKKLKLRAREITKLGYSGSDLVSFIIHHLHPHFITAEKQKVLKILKDLLNDPDKYRKDPIFKRIVERLQVVRHVARAAEPEIFSIHPEHLDGRFRADAIHTPPDIPVENDIAEHQDPGRSHGGQAIDRPVISDCSTVVLQ